MFDVTIINLQKSFLRKVHPVVFNNVYKCYKFWVKRKASKFKSWKLQMASYVFLMQFYQCCDAFETYFECQMIMKWNHLGWYFLVYSQYIRWHSRGTRSQKSFKRIRWDYRLDMFCNIIIFFAGFNMQNIQRSTATGVRKHQTRMQKLR